MPVDNRLQLFSGGLPIDRLNQPAKDIATELDGSRLVDRTDGALRGDGTLSPSEVKTALQNLDRYQPAEQDLIKTMARALGMNDTLAPTRREWQERTPPPHMEEARTAIALGNYIYLHDVDNKIHRYDPQNDRWTPVNYPDQLGRFTNTNWYAGHANPTLAEAGGALYLVGGSADYRPVPWVARYDVDSKSWNFIANMKNRSDAAAAGLDGKL